MEEHSKYMSEAPETAVEYSYPPKPKFAKWFVGFLLVFLVVGGTFRLGYISGERGYFFNTQSFLIEENQKNFSEADAKLLSQALKIVQSKYIDAKDIDSKKVLYGAISGAVHAAGDEYTQFFDPKALSDFKTDLAGSFSGIGAEIGLKNNAIVIIAPLDDTPAKKAGILAQDYIIAIDGQSTADMSVDDAVSKIRGPEGTKVKLTLLREGQEGTFDVEITRQKIELKSVKWSYKDINGKKVAILSISKFGNDTEDLLQFAISDINKNNPSAIIVDLRDNPGGFLDTAVNVASLWLEKDKLIVKEAHSDTDVISYTSDGSNQLGKYKTIVLLNGGSASAAEILAGALKDNNKAILLGERSFGKGSVQELVPFGKDMAIKVTIAKWITPNGTHLDHDGLTPDIEVPLTLDDIKAGKDTQLERALQEAVK